MKVGITLQSENWISALNNRESVEFETLESKLLSEVSFLWTCVHTFCIHVHLNCEFQSFCCIYNNSTSCV